MEESSTFIYSYLLPLTVLFGIIGNIISIIIYSRKSFNKKTSSSMVFYFKVLAFTDIISLLQFIQYIFEPFFGFKLKDTSDFACKVLMILNYTPAATSAWIEVLIALDRMVYLNCQNRFKLLKHKTFQIKIILTIFIMNIILYLPVSFDFKLKNLIPAKLDQLDETSYFNKSFIFCKSSNKLNSLIISYIDLVNFTIIPFFLMIITSIINVSSLYKNRYKFSKKNTCSIPRSNSKRRELKDLQFAISSLSLNFIYLIFNLPITLINIINLYFINEYSEFLFSLSIYLFFLKLSLPFYIYFIVNTNFRLELFSCVKLIVKK